MSLTILYWLLLIVMLAGALGTFIPGIPGTGLIVAAIIIWGIVQGWSAVSWALVTATVVLLLGIGIDFLATYLGAKRVGASSWGQIGAIIGLLAGIFGLLPALPIGGPLLGILIGPLMGAFLGEFLYRRNLELGSRARFSLKAGIAVVVSSLIGNLIQGALAIATIIVFLFTSWPPSAG
ncbi:MAG: DUF456 domain-containing protein [Cyanobacteria bacterium SW_4_48_29]|jgi:uncharacterized protein YqgC (DUF456 family)|nr:MAG: DUF456 domain-containing protein [Cyanobacteria bacterium QH_10_48_56]PSO58093.1 MAG: DUF456 domain-containing protein [Cyanobacteria bacterium QH_7_48_89]PSO74973.1 MAG: DUF456 domain-containing protein [Cyanobacteria bacterium QH_3_48_40]PSO97917.1 MAG: DUF456 domain-containing protein [Cyanobacteria bacterium SW_6_48_11]PSP29853.1 MAG: DUF456 domain-containing protein [Cyanobacteria bacterium SW_4_48_29]PSP36657.1 MAG: DUF456 domain-containing protein [Cyanobacteria bacterium QS_8_4